MRCRALPLAVWQDTLWSFPAFQRAWPRILQPRFTDFPAYLLLPLWGEGCPCGSYFCTHLCMKSHASGYIPPELPPYMSPVLLLDSLM